MKKMIGMLAIVATCLPAMVWAQPSNAKSEIEAAEKAFCNDLKSKGAAWAFHHYAAPNAIIKRDNDSLIMGKEGIKNYYSAPQYLQAKADWKADIIEVSNDGSMGYTIGKYTWTNEKADGNVEKFSGIFHTVWKRQANGEWKYVWD